MASIDPFYKIIDLSCEIKDIAGKFKGCLVGSLLGDCLGGFFEGQKHIPNSVLATFFSDIMEESKPILPYTDDTSMTISVAESLIEHRKIDSVDMAKRFVDGFFENANRRYGMNAANIFIQLRDSEFQDIFLPAKASFNGSGSAGNGAAMRVAPIALFAHDKDDDFIWDAAKECSYITHTHPNGYNGAILQCLAVNSALKLDPSKELDPVEFITELEEKIKIIETYVDVEDNSSSCNKKDYMQKLKELFIRKGTRDEEHPYCDRLSKIKNMYLKKQDDISIEEVVECLGNNVLALNSVPIAIYSFLKSLKPLADYESTNPFVRAIYYAISVGGDTDTIASMAGGIAGAYYGIDKIPQNIQHRCEKIDEVGKLADDLLKAAQTLHLILY